MCPGWANVLPYGGLVAPPLFRLLPLCPWPPSPLAAPLPWSAVLDPFNHFPRCPLGGALFRCVLALALGGGVLAGERLGRARSPWAHRIGSSSWFLLCPSSLQVAATRLTAASAASLTPGASSHTCRPSCSPSGEPRYQSRLVCLQSRATWALSGGHGEPPRGLHLPT